MMSKALLDSKISISEKVAELPIEAQLLYTWMIPHVDDLGLIQASPKTIKAQVIPMINVTEAQVDEWISLMRRNGLLRHVTADGKDFLMLRGHHDNQAKRRDIQPKTIIKFNFKPKAQDSWAELEKTLQTLENQTDVTPTERDVTERNAPERNVPEMKGKEMKGNELNNSKAVVKKKTQNEEDQPPPSEIS